MVLKSFNSAYDLRDWPEVKKVAKSQSLNFSLISNFITPLPIIQKEAIHHEPTPKLEEFTVQLENKEQISECTQDVQTKTNEPSRKRKFEDDSMDNEEAVNQSTNQSEKTVAPVPNQTPANMENMNPYEDKVYSLSELILMKLDDRTRLERHKLYHSRGTHKITRFCEYLTKEKCKLNKSTCDDVHYKKIIKRFTYELLGDCSYLDRCTNPRCRNLHYELDIN